MLFCQDRACGYRETISRMSNARCPVCHKRMELRGKGDGPIFVCSCGHKEKLIAFKERRAKEGAGVTKRDVARYMNQQKQKEEPLNLSLIHIFLQNASKRSRKNRNAESICTLQSMKRWVMEAPLRCRRE